MMKNLLVSIPVSDSPASSSAGSGTEDDDGCGSHTLSMYAPVSAVVAVTRVFDSRTWTQPSARARSDAHAVANSSLSVESADIDDVSCIYAYDSSAFSWDSFAGIAVGRTVM